MERAVTAATVPLRKRRPARSTVFSATSLASLRIAIPPNPSSPEPKTMQYLGHGSVAGTAPSE